MNTAKNQRGSGMTNEEIWERMKKAELELYRNVKLSVVEWAEFANSLERILNDILEENGFEFPDP